MEQPTTSNQKPVCVLAFDEQRLSACICQPTAPRSSGNFIHAGLGINILTSDSEIAATELKEKLAPLGKFPKHVVVALPTNSILTSTVQVPEMPAEARKGYLQLQAERTFLLPPEDMSLALPDGDAADIALAAIPANLDQHLRQIFKRLGFKQITLAPASPLLQDDKTNIVLVAWLHHIDFLCGGNGLIAFRQLTARPAGSGSLTEDDLEALPGELRISLGQIAKPAPHSVTVVSEKGLSLDIASELQIAMPESLCSITAASPADSLLQAVCEGACRALHANRALALVFHPFQKADTKTSWYNRVNRQQRTKLIALAALLILVPICLIFWQHHRLSNLEAEWNEISPQTTRIRKTIDRAKLYRAWASDEPDHLDILLAITEAFPETGSVWATRVEIKERQEISLNGQARSRSAWLTTLQALRQRPDVKDLRVAQARDEGGDKDNFTFSLNFQFAQVPKGRMATIESSRAESATSEPATSIAGHVTPNTDEVDQ